MDVQCERCSTRYEFDDALISARGTKVRCTNCGHQFRLQPSSVASDRWHVIREGLPPIEFGSLRELHQAIRQGQVTRKDRLLRDGRERVLGDIAELATFFAIASSPPARPTVLEAPATVSGPPQASQVRPPPVPPPPAVKLPSIPPPSAVSKATLPGIQRTPSVPPPVVQAAPPMRPLPQMRTIDQGTPMPPMASAPPRRDVVPEVDESARVTIPKVTQEPSLPIAREPSRPMLSSPIPPPIRDSLYTDRPSIVDDLGSSRRSMGGWVIAGVILLGAGVAGALVLRAHMTKEIETTPQVEQSADVDAIEKLLRAGRLNEAKAKLASVAKLGAQGVALRARVLTAIADEQWLLARLDPSMKPQAASQEASDATLKAFAATPDSPDVLRARIDALRIQGELGAARALVDKLPPREPETAYTLAALDVAQGGPLPQSVIERLTTASTGEGELGRARALLVSVLISLDRSSDARNELDRLSTLRSNHPALDLLRRALNGKDAGPSAKLDAAADANAIADAAAEGSSREASRAMAKRDFSQARSIYEALVAKSPGDPEALTGLGNVKRATGDSAGAIADYKRALAANSSYLPAMIALADTYWASGQQGEAMRIYREIVDRFPESAYPAHIAKRVKGNEPAEAGASRQPSATGKTEDPPSGEAPDSKPAPKPSAAPTKPAQEPEQGE